MLDSRPVSPPPAAPPPPNRPHATGLTIAFVILFGLALSFAPLPDDWRPFAELREHPRDAVVAALWPKGKTSAPSPLAPAPAMPPAAFPDDTLPEDEPDELPDEVAAAEGPAHSEADAIAQAMASLPEGAQADARTLEALARRVGARHAAIEQGCREADPSGACEEKALDPFFSALDELRAGRRVSPVHVVHLGDSLIASDYITGKVRERLQARYGSGGGGFFFVDRPTPNAGLKTRTGRTSDTWEIERITDKSPSAVLGLTGVAFASGAQGLSSSFDVRGSRLADILYLRQPGGGLIDVRADGQLLAQLSTKETGRATDVLRLALPADTKTLSVSTRGRVALYGVATEAAHGGVVYDSIGLPGATAESFLRADEEAFNAQLEARDPSLVVLMLGGNESFAIAQKRLTPQAVHDNYRALIERVRAGAPQAACLLVSPMAAGIRTMGGAVAARQGTRPVGEAMRAAALEGGCAFWDMLAAFGGDEALPRWVGADLMLEDLFHPRALGGDLLGHLFDFALSRAQQTRAIDPRRPLPITRGQPIDARRLGRVFDKLAQLSRGERERVGIVQLGASHTAAHFFTDETRRLLGERYGDAGRGFIAAGKASRRLEPSGVRRSLTGRWTMEDARDRRQEDALWGLTGVRAKGAPQARVEFTFCTSCTDDEVRSRLQLYYVDEPGMGAMEVRLDGQPVATLPEAAREAGARGVGVWSTEATGAMHRLEVRNEGPGAITLLGASAELERPGIVYDALGLPGSTVFTIAGYERDALVAQLKARAPDLFVLWYGTNESGKPEVDPEAMKQAYAQLFVALKLAAPDADCLLIAPTDRMARQSDRTWAPAPSQDAVLNALDEVAREHGCAVWSARQAMGGPGSMETWREFTPPLAHHDRVHLTPRGYLILAEAFIDDLLAAAGAADGGAR